MSMPCWHRAKYAAQARGSSVGMVSMAQCSFDFDDELVGVADVVEVLERLAVAV